MKNIREYPLFLIDRSKPESYPFDYVACFDKQVGFVARVVPFFKNDPLNIFLEKCKINPDFEYTSILHKFNNREGGVILVIEDFLHNFEFEKTQKERLKVLLKKAMKKYLHAQSDSTAHGDYSIDNQIKQMRLNLEHAQNTYDDLVKRAESKEYADYLINITKEIIKTLEWCRDTIYSFKK